VKANPVTEPAEVSTATNTALRKIVLGGSAARRLGGSAARRTLAVTEVNGIKG